MTTVFVLTQEGAAIGLYTSKGKARQEMTRRINEGIQWHVKNINPNGEAFAERTLKFIYNVVEMEIQE